VRGAGYEIRFARNAKDLDAIFKLRFEVFNLELGEGLDASFESRRDIDEFDPVCHHLMVVEIGTGRVVGSYRLQTGEMASTHRGFYSDVEFDLTALPSEVLESSVELGRACIARGHRSLRVLFLLWKGLTLYSTTNRRRYLFGCGSLTSQDPAEGKALRDHFEAEGLMHPTVRVAPRPGWECYSKGFEAPPGRRADPPPLLKAYLRYGARICGEPALDRHFKTIDYFVLFDFDALDRNTLRFFSD
jgi:putative hemolysin